MKDPGPDTIAVWWANLDWSNDQIDAGFSELSPDERERGDRFVQPIHRTRFIAARTFVRRVLAQYVADSPSAIRFEYGANGKPRLGEIVGQEKLCFNVAHSGDRAVLAVGHDFELGVDLEQICPKPNCLDIAGRFFASEEQGALRALDGEDRLRAFYRCWTRKEAYLKATGAGLSIPLDSFAVSIGGEKFPPLLRVSPGVSDRCTLIDIAPDQDFAATLAILNPNKTLPHIVQFHWPK